MSPVDPQVLEALAHGIKSEVASYVFYTEAARKPEARPYRETLEKLALEEKDHFHILERQYDLLVRSERWVSTADILKQDGLPEINEEMTAQHRELVDEVASAGSLRTVLDIAYRLEEEAYELFESQARETSSPEARKIFSELAKFEQGHMELIHRMIQETGP